MFYFLFWQIHIKCLIFLFVNLFLLFSYLCPHDPTIYTIVIKLSFSPLLTPPMCGPSFLSLKIDVKLLIIEVRVGQSSYHECLHFLAWNEVHFLNQFKMTSKQTCTHRTTRTHEKRETLCKNIHDQQYILR